MTLRSVAARVATPSSVLRRAWALPLAAHAAALLVVLGVVLVAFMRPTSAYTSDEGAYALQAIALQDGHWAYDHELAEYDDAEGTYFPLVNSDRGEEGWLAYARHPLWPTVLAASGSLFGNDLGLHLPSLLGAVGTACAAWCLAGALDRRAARPAFWLLATGPVLAHGFLLWAHAPFAAVSGFALVLALQVARGRGGRFAVLGCGALLALGLLLRSEGVFLAAATGLVVAGEVGRRAGARTGLFVLVGLGLPSAVALYVERAWVSSILGASVAAPASPATSGSSSYLAGRASGASSTLLAGSYGSGTTARVLALAAMVVPLLAVLALRRGGPRHDVLVGAGIAAGLLVARIVLAPGEPIGGLLPAWPLLVAGLAGAGAWLWRGPGRVLSRVSALVIVAVLLTQYPEGGGLEWGGRFLAALWVPLAALAAAGVAARWDGWHPGLRTVASRGAVTLGAASAIVCLVAVASLRADHEEVVAGIEATASPVAVSTIPSVPRLAWRTHGEVAWLLAEPHELDDLTARLAAGGVAEVTIVAFEEPTGAGFSEVTPAGDAVWVLTEPRG